MKKLFLLLFTISLAGLGGCSKPAEPERRIKFYQSPMHPWITSDQPGNCTICGMALVPVYEGQESSAPVNAIPLAENAGKLIGLRIATAEPREIQRTVRVAGLIEDDERRHRIIAAHYEGRIEKVYVDHVGETVKRGQPLASIYSPELLYVVREFQAAARKNPNDPIALNAKRRLIQFGLYPEQIDILAKESKEIYDLDILAPMDGTLLVRDVYAGQYVKTGETLFEMGELSTMWFHAEVYEQDLPAIRLGQKVSVTSPVAPGRTVEGVVTFIDPTFNPVNRSTLVRIEVPNPVIANDSHQQRRLFPHRVYAEGVIAADYGPQLSVPRSAVLNDGRRSVVYVDRGANQFVARPVRTGIVGDQFVQILDGLTAGEKVVSDGALFIDAEAQIRGEAAVESPTQPPSAPTLLVPPEKVAQMAAALAVDDVAAYTQALPTGQSPPADLPAARQQFLPFANAAAEHVRVDHLPGFTVFECPMTESSFPGAPPSARWVQTTGTEMQNPYLGKDMQFCGIEVKP